jgi:uncharacterized NAD(P)/FAD-binding protein YdhS
MTGSSVHSPTATWDRMVEGMDVVRDEPVFDVAVIGSGVACSLTWVALADEFKSSSTPQPSRIAVIEDDAEFWRVVKDEGRSSPNAFIITKRDQVLPDDESQAFGAWPSGQKVAPTVRGERIDSSVAQDGLAEERSRHRQPQAPRLRGGRPVHGRGGALPDRASARGIRHGAVSLGVEHCSTCR